MAPALCRSEACAGRRLTPIVKFWMNMSYFSAELMLPTIADRFMGLLPVLRPLTTTLIWGRLGWGRGGGGQDRLGPRRWLRRARRARWAEAGPAKQ
jgi:hypothetical protein